MLGAGGVLGPLLRRQRPIRPVAAGVAKAVPADPGIFTPHCSRALAAGAARANRWYRHPGRPAREGGGITPPHAASHRRAASHDTPTDSAASLKSNPTRHAT